jgi:hypothetical protein
MPRLQSPRSARAAVLGAAVLLSIVACAAHGQVDPSGPWRTWRTDHFRVHAHAGLEPEARAAAREAERAYDLLATELRPPRGTIDLVIADNVDFSNGYASVFPSNRLTVYLPPPTGSPSLGFYDSWLRLVLVHELTHVFHLDRAGGVWGVLQAVFGRAPGLFPNVYQPSWVAEGLATYYESRFSTAGRARGSFHRAVLAAAARGDAWPGRGDVWLTTAAWPAGHRPYAWGTEFFRVVADEYGDGVVPQLVDGTSNQLWPFAVSRHLRRAGATDVGQGWTRLRERALADGGQPAPTRTILDRGLRVQPRPRVSPDGTRLAYVHNDGRSDTRVVVRSIDTWTESGSHRVNGAADLAWVGDTLYVAQHEFTSPVEIRADLFRWPPDGTWKRLTHGARLDQPFATPDGGIGAVDVESGARRAVAFRQGEWQAVRTPDADAFARIAVAPDGSWLAAARHRNGQWDIVVWPSGSPHDARAITDDVALDSDPVWSADGRVLWFASEREGFSQVYAYRVDDALTYRMTAEPASAMEPAPSIDGTFYYTALFEDGYALVQATAMPLESSEMVSDGRTVEPAPEVSIVGGAYRPWPALGLHYWVPWWHDEGSTGVFVSALTSGEDPIGRTAYVGAVGAAPDPFRWEAVLSVAHTRWKHFRLEATISQLWDGASGVTAEGTPVALGERERRATLGLGWRWRRIRSAVGALVSTGFERSAYFDDRAAGAPLGSTPTFLTARISAYASHASSPALAISQENGVSVDGFVERRWALSDPRWSYEIRGGVSGYLAMPFPGFAHWVLAARMNAGRTGGTAPERLEVGGESGDLLEALPGLALGAGRRAFPLRGYPRGGAFTRAFTSMLEVRVPMLQVARGWNQMPAFLDRVSLSFFAEVGGGWSEGEEPAPTTLRDVGGEIVLDVGLIRDYPLRLRGGVGVPLTDGLGVNRGRVRGYVVLGSSF